MERNLLLILLFSAIFLALFIINEIIYNKFKINSEYTRKIAHIGTGLIAMTFPVVFEEHYPVLIMAIGFFILLISSKKYNFFKSINKVERKTWGSFLFPVSVYICFYFSIEYSNKAYFYIPILIMSLSDPLAAFFGKIFNKKPEKKSFSGSFAFFISALIISIILLNIFYDFKFITLIFLSLTISFLGTITERVSKKGFDNLTIPLVVLAILFFVKIWF